jgi:hypothetical protein
MNSEENMPKLQQIYDEYHIDNSYQFAILDIKCAIRQFGIKKIMSEIEKLPEYQEYLTYSFENDIIESE